VVAVPGEPDAATRTLLDSPTAILGQTSSLAETANETLGALEPGTRASSATVAAIDASAAAIDEIVAAAEAAMVEEAARAQQPRQTPLAKPAFVEIAAPAALGGSTATPQAAGTGVAGAANQPAADAAGKAVVPPAANASTQVVDNALSAIMALSEEERLALFT
jgi:hypothetical protein